MYRSRARLYTVEAGRPREAVGDTSTWGFCKFSDTRIKDSEKYMIDLEWCVCCKSYVQFV